MAIRNQWLTDSQFFIGQKVKVKELPPTMAGTGIINVGDVGIVMEFDMTDPDEQWIIVDLANVGECAFLPEEIEAVK